MPVDDADARRLRELSERIEAAKARRAPPPKRGEEAHGQAEVAWRMVIELVAGIGIGTAIGYGLDALLGTMPWFLIVFCLAGFAAGINVMMRTAREITEANASAETTGADAPTEMKGAQAPTDSGAAGPDETGRGPD